MLTVALTESQAQAQIGHVGGRGGQGKGLINRAQPGFEFKGRGSCCVGQVGLGSRGSGTCTGCLVPVLYRHDGGFAEEAILVVHQVLVDAGSTTGEGIKMACVSLLFPTQPLVPVQPTYLQDLWPQGWNTAEMG